MSYNEGLTPSYYCACATIKWYVMFIAMGEPEVLHDEAAKKFYAPLGEYQAVLMYARQGEVLDLYHTYVPESHRNHGLAERLVTFGFEHAKRHRLKVRPSCSYIAQWFVPRHPEYHSLLELPSGGSS